MKRKSVSDSTSPHDTSAARSQRLDWGRALAVPSFYGREQELRLLHGWIVQERCQIVGVLGMGGIGKSALSVNLMHQIAEHFDAVIWRSLRDAPTCEALLDDCLPILASQPTDTPFTSLEERIDLLLDYLREQRVLLVLDNLETLLEEGADSGHMRPGYTSYEKLLRRMGQTQHQSCVVFTSREKPVEIAPLEGKRSLVRVLNLASLEPTPCELLLTERGVTGTDRDRLKLIDHYTGNPLALKIVTQTIVDLFDGEIALFLNQGEIIFGSIRHLLDEQFARLSDLEQSVLLWLAILREPSTLDDLLRAFAVPESRARLLEATGGLHRRSLIERGQQQGSFTLQSVVLEYATSRLIAEIGEEIQTGQFMLLIEHGLELAHAREYVRETQQRLIVAPILALLRGAYFHQTSLEQRLLALFDHFRSLVDLAQGYGPANLLTLLKIQRGDLRGLDLSRLALRSVYVQGVDMQDTSLSNAVIQSSAFTQELNLMTALAFSPNGDYWAVSSGYGDVHLWTADQQMLYRTWRAHADMIWALAFSPDGLTLVSVSWDTTVKLWDVASGLLLWSGEHTSHVNIVGFSPDGTMVASSGDDGIVRIWDRYTGKHLQNLPHPGPASGAGVIWSPDGRLIASGDLEGHIRLWEIQTNRFATCIQTIEAHETWVDGLAFSPDGTLLASASWDRTVKLWEVASGQLKHTLTGHTEMVYRVVWSSDGRFLASCSRDQTVWIWDVERGSYQSVLRGHSAGVRGLAFTQANRTLFSCGEDGSVRIWDVMSGQCLRIIQGHTPSLLDIDWSPDGTHLVSGGADYLVTIYSLAGERPPQVLSGHKGGVNAVSWSPNGDYLASGEWDNAVRLWNPKTGEYLQSLQHPHDISTFFFGLAWSPDGQRLAVGTHRHGVEMFEISDILTSRTEYLCPAWIFQVV